MSNAVRREVAVRRPTARPVSVAIEGKGAWNLARRSVEIAQRFGLGPGRIERRLLEIHELLADLDCSPTLPITAAAAQRHPEVVARLAAAGVEFPVHGFFHVDHVSLTAEQQIAQLRRARETIEAIGIEVVGFRAPYLRCNADTLEAVRAAGFLYDSSQAIAWPIDPTVDTDAYRRVLRFCDAILADRSPVVPWVDDGLLRIPYCLPDDEAILDRLRISSPAAIARLWEPIAASTHERGDLLTLAVHPERIPWCAEGLHAVLERARALGKAVWIARFDEIARWWLARTSSKVDVHDTGDGVVRVTVEGPERVAILVRGIDVPASERSPIEGYVRAPDAVVEVVDAPFRPFIGLHPACPPTLAPFLREQGYIVEHSTDAGRYACFLRSERFRWDDRQTLIEDIERSAHPLVKLGRWPDGARSALAVTGDIDALTVVDYAWRFLGR